MEKLRVPSLQHLARNWRETPEQVAQTLIKLVENPPTFSYSQLFDLVRDLLVLHQPLDVVMEAVRRHVKRDSVRDNFLELLPLINDYFAKSSPAFVQEVAGRMYPIARGLMVPFAPPLIYGANDRLFFPWFSFWKSNPLANEKLSLFITIVDEILMQDADLDSASFQILDFSAPGPHKPRALSVIDAREIPRLSEARKQEMLTVFAEGYFIAQEKLSSTTGQKKASHTEVPRDDRQAELFT